MQRIHYGIEAAVILLGLSGMAAVVIADEGVCWSTEDAWICDKNAGGCDTSKNNTISNPYCPDAVPDRFGDLGKNDYSKTCTFYDLTVFMEGLGCIRSTSAAGLGKYSNSCSFANGLPCLIGPF